MTPYVCSFSLALAGCGVELEGASLHGGRGVECPRAATLIVVRINSSFQRVTSHFVTSAAVSIYFARHCALAQMERSVRIRLRATERLELLSAEDVNRQYSSRVIVALQFSVSVCARRLFSRLTVI